MTASVLLVEDQHNVRALVRDFLKANGDFQVVASLGTEAEALNWVQHHPDEWDLAVVDLVLDQGTGINVIKRARAASPRGRIVVLSGFATKGIRQRCEQLGADAVFDKADMPGFARFCRELAPRGATRH